MDNSLARFLGCIGFVWLLIGATPNMSLDLPVVGTTVGPTWAQQLNTAFTVVDTHDHTSGNGVRIPSSALNINGIVPFNNNHLSSVKSCRFQDQAAPLSTGSDLRSLYSSGGDLYYNNGAGTFIQITSGSGLNVSSLGGFGGDYIASGASAIYTDSSKLYTFRQPDNSNADILARNITASNNVNVDNILNVTGVSNLNNDLNVSGDVVDAGTLMVDGIAAMNSDLDVQGTINTVGDEHVGGSIDITGFTTSHNFILQTSSLGLDANIVAETASAATSPYLLLHQIGAVQWYSRLSNGPGNYEIGIVGGQLSSQVVRTGLNISHTLIPNGNFGINRTPAFKFDVADPAHGVVANVGNIFGDGQTSNALLRVGTNVASGNYAGIEFERSGSFAAFATAITNGIQLGANGDGTNSTLYIGTTSGTARNVGIRTNAPAFALEINGTTAPSGDDIFSLGTTSNRFREVHASDGYFTADEQTPTTNTEVLGRNGRNAVVAKAHINPGCTTILGPKFNVASVTSLSAGSFCVLTLPAPLDMDSSCLVNATNVVHVAGGAYLSSCWFQDTTHAVVTMADVTGAIQQPEFSIVIIGSPSVLP